MDINGTIQDCISPAVEAAELSGAVTLVWNQGEVVHAGCSGCRSVEAQSPMERTTLFRIASMTKPITSVAALQAMEDGRFQLSDSITRWVPEFSDMRVLRSTSGALDDTVPADREITMLDLLCHRTGLTYGDFHDGPIGIAYSEALGLQIDCTLTPDNWVAELAGLPLVAQPGTDFTYGVSTDLLGFVLARIDGKSLGEVLQDRIFDRLGMADTAFQIAPENRSRAASAIGFGDDDQLTDLEDGPGKSFLGDRPAGTTFESGGAGLWSTVDDYLRFARVLLEDGEVDGARVLRPDTLRMMRTNVLTASQRANAKIAGFNTFDAGHGFALGVAVVMEPDKAPPFPCGGSVGAVGWPGAYGGWWRVDPGRGVILIFLAHCMADLDQRSRGLGFGAMNSQARFAAATARLGISV